MVKVLIIGENSYIGNTFQKYILDTQMYSNNEQWIVDKTGASNGEWRDKDFNGYDTILNVAAIVHKKEKNQSIYYRINRDMAAEIAQKAKACNVGHFVFISTMAVYGSNTEKITKDTETIPTNNYGKSKLEAEIEILKLVSDGFKVAIVRPPLVYGAGCKGNFTKLTQLAKILPLFPNCNNKRSMIYIGNLCEALRIIIKDKKYGIYHVQNSDYVNTSQLYKNLRSALNKRTVIISGSENLKDIFFKRLNFTRKIFGNCYYEMNMLKNELNPSDYCIYDFDSSIKLSLKNN